MWLGRVVPKCADLEETLGVLVEKDEVRVKSEGMMNVMTRCVRRRNKEMMGLTLAVVVVVTEVICKFGI